MTFKQGYLIIPYFDVHCDISQLCAYPDTGNMPRWWSLRSLLVANSSETVQQHLFFWLPLLLIELSVH